MLLKSICCSIDFADALANPMKYLSEKEKRTQQLEALMMMDEQEQNESEKMNVSLI